VQLKYIEDLQSALDDLLKPGTVVSAGTRHRVEDLTTRIRHRAKVLCGVAETTTDDGEEPRAPTNTPSS
jgi:hypothetical protein